MKALTYLLAHRVKNQVLDFFKKPLHAILLLIVVASMTAAVVFPNREGIAGQLPMRNLYAMGYGLFILMFCLMAYNGLGHGVSLFSMSDVSLLFPSPLSPRRILFYGCVQTLGRYMLMSLMLFAQYGWMHTEYGVEFHHLLFVLLLYALTCFLGQLTAMVIYAWINGDRRRRRIATIVFFGLIGVFAAVVFVMALQSHRPGLMALTTQVNKPVLKWFPVGGWFGAVFQAVMSGSPRAALPFAAVTLAYAGVLVFLLRSVGSGFYEDVLDATTRNHQAITARKEGRVTESLPDHVRRGAEGLGKGQGASALYYKHRLESRRAGRLLFDTQTLILMVIHLVFSYLMRKSGFMPAFAFGIYILFFSANSGRWVRELTMPWVYRIPEGSFVKLLWCMRESVQKLFLQSLIMMVASGLLTEEKPLTIAMAVICHFLFAVLFMVGNIAGDRLYGQIRSRAVALALYALVMVVLMIPSITLLVLALMRSWVFVSINFTLMVMLAAPMLVTIPLCLAFGRHVLDNVEMNG